MELTKEQIQYIENRLINEGVNYWDIRIEMLDHIVTDVENQLEYGDRFDEVVQNAMVKLGWVGDFKNIIDYRRNSIMKSLNKKLKEESLRTIKQPAYILAYGVLLFFLFNFIEFKSYKWIMITLIVAYFFIIIFSFINYKKFFKSIYLGTLLSISFFTLNIMNLFIYMPKIIIGKDYNSPIYLSVVTAFLVPLFFVELTLLFKEYKKTNTIYKKLFL